jgi:hypothetical protein
MRELSLKIFILFLLISFLSACSDSLETESLPEIIASTTLHPSKTVSMPQDQQQSEAPSAPTQITPENYETFVALIPSRTPKPTSTKKPTRTPTLAPPTAVISVRTPIVNPTIEAFGNQCQASETARRQELSPDGTWITMACQGPSDSNLKIMSVDGSNAWTVYYADFAGDADYISDDMLNPHRWSQNGKYLYVSSPSRTSGCCWFGSETILIRVNLANGQQTKIVSVLQDEDAPTVDLSFSPSERSLLYIPQSGQYPLIILDLGTWRTRTIEIENLAVSGAGYSVWSNDEEQIVLMVIEWHESQQRFFYSLVLVNLADGSQKILLTDQKYSRLDSLHPIRWLDPDHVLLNNNPRHLENGDEWRLNIHTAELTEIANP